MEVISRESGDFSEAVEASQMVAESPRRARDNGCPGLETDQAYAHWRLRAVLKRRMAFDPEVQLFLNVYNGPTTTGERWSNRGA